MLIERLEARTLLAFGDLDATFGTGGRALLPFDRGDAAFNRPATDVIVLSDGRIATVGDELALYDSSGALDPSFGAGAGFISLGFSSDRQLAQSHDGDLLVFELVNPRLRSFKLDGTVDTSFGQNGTFVPPVTDPLSGPFGLKQDSQGRIYLFVDEAPATELQPSNPSLETRPIILRLTPAGVLDSSFGTNGVLRPDLTDAASLQLPPDQFVYASIDALTIDGNDRMLVTGRRNQYILTIDNRNHDQIVVRKIARSFPLIARLSAGGTPDTTFDGDGLWFDSAHPDASYTSAAITRSDGSAVAAFNLTQRTSIIEIPDQGALGSSITLRRKAEQDLRNIDDIEMLPDGRIVLSDIFEMAWAKRLSANNWEIGPVMSKVPFHPVLGRSGGGAVNGDPFKPMAIQPDGQIVTAGQGFVDGGDKVRSNDDRAYQLARVSAGNIADQRPDVLPDGTGNAVVVAIDLTTHIAYHDDAADNLKYRVRDYSGRWGAIETIDAGPATGADPSIAIDSNGNVAVAYFDGIGADLKLARRESNGTWTITIVDSRGGTGLYPDLKFDRTDRPWIAYYNKTKRELRLAGFIDGRWRIETLDSAGDAGRTPSLAENLNTGRWSVAYTAADHTLRFADRQKDKSFAITTVAQTGRGAYDPVLASEDDDGTPGGSAQIVIAYYDADANDLVVTRRAAGSSTFSSTRLDTPGYTGLYPQITPQLVFPFLSQIWWWDRSDDSVTFGSDRVPLREQQPRPLNTDTIVGGGRFLSVASRARNPTMIMLVYLDTASGDLFVRRA